MQFHLHEMNHTFSDLVLLLKKNYRIIDKPKIKDTSRSENTKFLMRQMVPDLNILFFGSYNLPRVIFEAEQSKFRSSLSSLHNNTM